MLLLLPQLRAYARFLTRHTHEADDLVQEAVMRALGALAQYQRGTSLRAWMFTIVRNVFFEQNRRRNTERAALAQSELAETSEAPPQTGHMDLADLARHLFALPPLLREALVLVGAQGLSYEEAAAICSVPVGTMKARVSRGRGLLARHMDGQRDEGKPLPGAGSLG
jgi:RNA polymerase sigma-70 factor (ECF subfamily)